MSDGPAPEAGATTAAPGAASQAAAHDAKAAAHDGEAAAHDGEAAAHDAKAAAHDAKVAAVAARVRELVASREPVRILKGGVHHVVPLPGDVRFDGRSIDVSSLSQILAIDPAARRCTAEPGVTFAELVRATLRHNLLPVVVPELEGITIGGAVAGCSVESMSYRHGGFHDGCLAYEVVTGTGEVLTCSREHDPFLFDMLHGSYGTLGILTRLTFRLVPAAPFVHLEYRRFARFEAFEAALRDACRFDRGAGRGGADFVDAIIHGPSAFVLCLGRFADAAPYTSDYRRAGIFYESTRDRDEDYLATADYCFRYDADCHWLTRAVAPLRWRPVRRALGRWVLGSTNLIEWSRRLEPLLALKRRPDVVVDLFVPSRRFREMWGWYERTIHHYPLWVVPYRMPSPYPWIADAHRARMADDLFMDCAIYGMPNGQRDVDYSQVIEDEIFELGGLKTLISRNHYTRERFWQIYDLPHYRAAKSRLDPKGLFGDPYEHFSHATPAGPEPPPVAGIPVVATGLPRSQEIVP